jgi:imidazolonepropionase-like amidohydrolase
VPVYTGTDAGGFVAHGRIVDEIVALTGIGLDATRVLRAATMQARTWLAAGALADGDRADMLVLTDDPRADLDVLRSPAAVVVGGAVL